MNIKDYKPGQTVTVPGFAMQYHFSDTPTWHSTELVGSGYVTLAACDITFTLPPTFNAVAAEVSSIDRDLTAAADAYHTTVSNLRARKEALLQLTFEAPAEDVSELVDKPAADTPSPRFLDINDDIPF